MTTTASPADLRIASLVHAAAATLQGPNARFGDRKVFIFQLWHALPSTEHLGLGQLQDFKAWLLRAMRMQDAAGAPLVLLARADLVAAMPAQAVAASEIVGDGCTFHFVVDRAVAHQEYAPRTTNAAPEVARRGRIGGGR